MVHFDPHPVKGIYRGRGSGFHSLSPVLFGFGIIGGTGRDDISMLFASRDFGPCWIYTWVAVKLLLENGRKMALFQSF